MVSFSGKTAGNGQVRGQNIVFVAEDHRLFHHVFQLADVARPVVVLHGLEGGGREYFLKTVFLVGLPQEGLDQGHHVARPFPERRDLDGNDVEAVVEILPEGLFVDHIQQIPVGSGDDAHVDRDGPGAAHPGDLHFLQHPQQMDLHLQGQVADLVEENGSVVGALKDAHFSLPLGSGEGPPLVSEELAFDERGRDGAAVDADEALFGAL